MWHLCKPGDGKEDLKHREEEEEEFAAAAAKTPIQPVGKHQQAELD